MAPPSLHQSKRQQIDPHTHRQNCHLGWHGEVPWSSSLLTLANYLDPSNEIMLFACVYTVSYFTELCPEDNFSLSYSSSSAMIPGSLVVTWPKSPVGTVNVPCPCGNLTRILPFTASRMCVLDDFNQAQWLFPNISQCQELSFDFCTISEVIKIAVAKQVHASMIRMFIHKSVPGCWP